MPGAYLDFTDEIVISFRVPDSVRALTGENTVTLQMDWSVNSQADWKCSAENSWSSTNSYGKTTVNMVRGQVVEQISMFRSNYNAPADGGYESICCGLTNEGEGFLDLKDNTIYLKLRFWVTSPEGTERFSPWTEVFTVEKKVDEEYNASDWAQEWIASADGLGLIPDSLIGVDYTRQITRAEFAALSVKVYEALTGKVHTGMAPKDTFTDCADEEVLKAYDIGITDGMGEGKFVPDKVLSRQEAATMLTRVYKRVAIAGWTLGTDGDYAAAFKAMFTMPAAFADDANIDSWAKDSVYFMKAKDIIDGVGGNMFAPKHGVTQGESVNYGLATREAALKIAVGMVKNLAK